MHENLNEIELIEFYAISAIIGVIFFAISSVMTKYLIPMSGGPYAFFTINLTIGIFIVFPLALILAGTDSIFINSLSTLWILFLVSLFAFLGYVAILVGFQKGNVSVGGIILSSRVFVSIPLGFFLIGERYDAIIYILIIVAFLGSLIVSWNPELSLVDVIKLKAPGMKWFILTSIFWASSNFFTRYLNRELETSVLLLYRQIFMIILAWTFFMIGRKTFDDGEIELSNKLIQRVLIYLVVLLFAQFSYIYALGYSLTITEGIGISEGFFTLIFSLFVARFIDNSVLNEPLDRYTLIVKFIGATIAGISTLMVVILV